MGDTNITTTIYHQLPANISTMQHRGYIVFLGLLSALLGDCSEKLGAANEKAASPLINCGCQCSSLTFRDAGGVVHGNCLTVDSTGAQWCYVDPAYSSCQDLVPSKRFPNNPWSYEACATPAQGSPLCPAIAAPVIPVVPVAPAVVPHEPVHVHPTYPVEPVHHPVHHPVHQPVHQPVPPAYPVPQPHPVAPSSAGAVETVGPQVPLGPATIQEIFGANGGYDPESIGEPRQGDASSKINLPGLE